MNSTTRAKRKSHITLEATTRRQDSERKTVVGGHQKHEQGNRNIKQEDHEARSQKIRWPYQQECTPARRHRGNDENTGEVKGGPEGHAPSIPRAKARNQNTSQTRSSATTAYLEETDVLSTSSHASPEEEFFFFF